MAFSDDIRKTVQKQAMEVTMKLMSDERTRPYVAKAMQQFMESKQRAETVREDLLTTLGLASMEQLKAAKKDANKLAKKVEKLQASIEELQAQLQKA